MGKTRNNRLIGALFLFLMFISNIPSIFPLQEVKNPSTFIIETIDGPRPLDPATNDDSFGSGINELVYETLIDYTGYSTLNVRPCLATAWEITDGGLNYTFTLRQGIKYHDGSDFNAWTMKYSLDRAIIMNDWFGPSWILAQVIKGASVYQANADANVSDAIDYLNAGGIIVEGLYQLRIELEQAYPAFIYVLITRVAAAVSPKAIIENMPVNYNTDPSNDLWGQVPLTDWFPDLAATNDWNKLGLESYHNLNASGVIPSSAVDSDQQHEWMAKHAVGTGPYKLVSLIPESEIRLVKNENWWGTFHEHAVEEVRIKTVNEVATRIEDIKTGDTDTSYIPETHLSEILNTTTKTVRPEFANNIQVFCRPTFSTIFFCMHMNDSLSLDFIHEDETQSTYNSSLWPRYSWNTSGPGAILASPENPFTSHAFRKAFTLSFDYETFINNAINGFAERLEGLIPNGMFGHHDLLVEEGLIPEYDPEAAKSLFETVGWKGTITIGYDHPDNTQKLGYLLLKNTIENMEIGINIKFRTWACLPVVEDIVFPLYLFNWTPDYADPDSVFSKYAFSQFQRRFNYENPNLEKIIENAAKEPDSTIREEEYHSFEEMLAQDSLLIYAYQINDYVVLRTWIQSYLESGSLNPMSFMPNLELISKIDYETTTTKTVTTTTTKTVTTTTTKTITMTETTPTETTTTESTTATVMSVTTTNFIYGFKLLVPMFVLLVYSLIVIKYKGKNKK